MRIAVAGFDAAEQLDWAESWEVLATGGDWPIAASRFSPSRHAR